MATTNSTPNGVDRIESAANISLVVSSGANPSGRNEDGTLDEAQVEEVPISRLDATKDIEITQIRESSVKATGYSITSISYSGSMMFKGSTLTRVFGDKDQTLYDIIYDAEGLPVPVSITIYHDMNGNSETYQTVLVTSDSYQVRNEEVTETAFDWVAMDRTSDQPAFEEQSE